MTQVDLKACHQAADLLNAIIPDISQEGFGAQLRVRAWFLESLPAELETERIARDPLNELTLHVGLGALLFECLADPDGIHQLDSENPDLELRAQFYESGVRQIILAERLQDSCSFLSDRLRETAIELNSAAASRPAADNPPHPLTDKPGHPGDLFPSLIPALAVAVAIPVTLLCSALARTAKSIFS